MERLIGRKEERVILEKALHSQEGELISVIGRRRVGKTYLIRKTYEGKIAFEITGIQNGSLKEQLENFSGRLNFHLNPNIPYVSPQNWQQAFQMLIMHFEKSASKEKYVLFFDEFSWMSTKRSGFLKAFGVFWNSWAVQRNVVVVICGSAVSWITRKVIRDKGGLHNRITRRIQLQPFNLYETRAFLQSNSIDLELYQIIQIYMATGGIPHYLKEIEKGESAAQNIDRLFFSPQGLLRDEFEMLFPALFENWEYHVKIIRLLAKHREGLTQAELITKTKLSNGGSTVKLIEDLVLTGFVTPYYRFGKLKNHRRFKLTDEYTAFYLKFVEKNRTEGKGVWQSMSETQGYKIWSGFAFESLCFKHISQIKKALGISGVLTETSVYFHKGTEELPGVQIDMLIDRKDRVINLIEMKFYNSEFSLTADYAKKLRQKAAIFKTYEKTKKQLFWTLITTFGIFSNKNSIGLIDKSLSMEVLFEAES